MGVFLEETALNNNQKQQSPVHDSLCMGDTAMGAR